MPLAVAVDAANVPDMCLAGETLTALDDLPVPRPAPTRRRPQGLCMDKGYDYPIIHELAQLFDFVAHLRSRGEEAGRKRKGLKARRWVVERAASWLNRFRRLLIRWEKHEDNYLVMLHFACAHIALQHAGLLG